jgi:hypothetical protein
MQINHTSTELFIELSFWEKVLSLHGNFQIPKNNITSITEGKPNSSWLDLKIPGTFFPGLIKAGTFYTRRGKEFWHVTNTHRFVYTIKLQDMSYKRIVVGTEKPIGL